MPWRADPRAKHPAAARAEALKFTVDERFGQLGKARGNVQGRIVSAADRRKFGGAGGAVCHIGKALPKLFMIRNY